MRPRFYLSWPPGEWCRAGFVREFHIIVLGFEYRRADIGGTVVRVRRRLPADHGYL